MAQLTLKQANTIVEKALAKAREMKIKPLGVIVLDESGKIANLLETTVLPTSIVVDRKGQIVWKKYGAIMEGDEELKKAIEGAVGSSH